MYSKLKADEIRALLAQRGLDTSGNKLVLLKRLESSCAGDGKSDGNSSPVTGKKRSREMPHGDEAQMVGSVEEIRKMGVQQLREQAAFRGLPTSGSKRDLVERVFAAIQESSEDVPAIEERLEDVSEEKVDGEKKLVTATKKGGAVLDQWLPDHIKSNYHVLQQGDEIYDAILNQTNVGANNNKFYVIQALESDDGGTFMVYNRWGRVGVKGQDKLHGPYMSHDRAISEFEQKFFDKTRNEWSDRSKFVCYPKLYTWLEMDYNETEKEASVS